MRRTGVSANLEVAAENVGPSEAHLAARVAAGVVGDIVHLRHVAQLDVVARHGTAHVTSARVAQLSDGGCSAAFGLAVALDQRATHGDTEQVHDIASDGSRACDHQPASAA